MKKLLFLILTVIGLECHAQETRLSFVVEHMPTFNGGGLAEFNKFIGQNLQYPASAVKNGITGKVFVSFVVNEIGLVGDVKIARSAHPLLDSAAIRVVRSSPMWIPGFLTSKTIPVPYTVPISFMLNSKGTTTDINEIVCTPESSETIGNSIAPIQPETIQFFTSFYDWANIRRWNFCDGFDGLLVKSRLKVRVASRKEFVFVVYENNGSIITTNTFEGQRGIRIFCNTPPGDKVTLLAIKVENGITYFSCQTIIPSPKEIFKLDYQQTNAKQLKEVLEAIGK